MVDKPSKRASGVRSVSRRKFLAATGAASVAVIAGCAEQQDTGDDENGGADGELSGELVITGSSTVFPISDTMAERFMDEHPSVNITVDSTGSGGGFENHFCHGDSAINGASRPIKDAEEENCQGNDVEPVEFEIAGDALTMAVNNDADWVDCMTFDEMAQIWQEDGAETWADVNADWPDEEFELYGPDTTSGTFDWFTENVVGEAGNHRSDYEPTEDDNLIVQGIENSESAIGYFGYAYYEENEDRITGLEVEENESDGCVAPSLEAAKEGDYPMARPLLIYVSEETLQREEVYEFVKFYLEQAETDLVSDIGYVPSSEEQRDENLDKLDEAAGQ